MIPEVIRPMLAEMIPDKRDLSRYERTHIAQIKYDGTRVIADVGLEDIRLISRSAKTDYSELYPDICAELAKIGGRCVLDGELIFVHRNSGLSEYVKADSLEATRANHFPVLMVFDVLRTAQGDLRDYEQIYRTSIVNSLLSPVTPGGSVREVITFESQFPELYMNVVDSGGEGIILKDRRGKYRHDGKNDNRSRVWLKAKRDETADCVVMGIQTGKGKTASTFGALILGQVVQGKVMEVGRASGMTDAERRILLGIINHIPESRTSDLFGDKSVQRAIEPRLVVEIEFMERSPKGRLRHPRYKRMRSDKPWQECTMGAHDGS